MRSRLAAPAGSVLLLLLLLPLWSLVASRVFVVPTPIATWRAFFKDLEQPTYIDNLTATAQGSGVAFLIAVISGALLGVMLGLSPRLRDATQPLVVAINGLPKIVLYPLLLLVFGMGLPSKIAMGALFGAFPVTLNLSAALRDLPPVYLKLGRSLQANPLQLAWWIYLPATLRPLLTGVRLAFSLSLVGVVLAELFATRYGLGRVIARSYNLGRYPEMVATILVLLGASLIGSLLIWQLEKRIGGR